MCIYIEREQVSHILTLTFKVLDLGTTVPNLFMVSTQKYTLKNILVEQKLVKGMKTEGIQNKALLLYTDSILLVLKDL